MQHTPRFDVAQLHVDMAGKGWQPIDLASQAEVAQSTVSRFLNGEIQTARVAKKLANALGYSVRRYVRRAEEAVAP